MKVLSKRRILLLHQQPVDETGGSPGLRDEGLLDLALNAPFQAFDDTSANPSLQQKAARLPIYIPLLTLARCAALALVDACRA